MRSTFALSLLAIVVPALGVPTLIPITKRAGPFKENSYIIKLKDDFSKPTFVDALTSLLGGSGSQSSITYDYDGLFSGVAVQLNGLDMLKAIQAMKGIEYIEQDSIMSISYEVGLGGISTVREPVDALVYQHLARRTDPPRGSQGEGVVIYSMDTGVYLEHECFGGRASWGVTIGGHRDQDGDGHGTHTAATAAGEGFGLATKSEIVAVKVLSDTGFGPTSDIIEGIVWAATHAKSHGKPSVVNMSLGGEYSRSMNCAVEKAIGMGLHFTIAAGNNFVLAELFSPSSAKSANIVGAVDRKNAKAPFSNFGPVLDVWALGVDVLSAWKDGPTSTATLSGTSMAAPHVAGVLAVAISKYGNKAPDQLSKDLRDKAQPVVTGALLSTNRLAKQW